MRPTQAHIDLAALRHNCRTLAQLVGDEVSIIPVVKADAYGHGAVGVSWALTEEGVNLVAVATLEEALELQESGIPARFLILGGITGESNLLDIPPDCIPVVWDEDGLNFSNALPSVAGRPVEVHLKIDTGMTRLGCRPDQMPRLFDIALGLDNVRVTGVMSHLSSADGADTDDVVFTHEQVLKFRESCRNLAMGIIRHLGNSAGALAYPECRLDAVRPGLMLYGIWPFPDFQPRSGLSPESLKPVMCVKTTVLAVRKIDTGTPVSYGRAHMAHKPEQIAVIPAGYADGVPRKLSNRGAVIIGGKKRNIVGNVTMDYIMVDVSEQPEVFPGDEVVIMGKQGSEQITAWDIAKQADTIPYEITCNISKRVTRMPYDDYGKE